MILIDENSGTHNIISRRALNIKCLDNIQKSSFPSSSTSSNYLHGSRRCSKPRHCTETSSIPANRSIVAATLFGASSIRFAERRSSPRSYPKNFSTQNYRCCRSHAAHNACQRDPLEHSHDGQSSRFERSFHSSDMAETQFKASFNRDLQVKPGQTIHRKTTRCCWPLFESTRQGTRLMCRREKSNSSPRSDKTLNATTPWYSSSTDARLYAPWDNHAVCRTQHARWQGHRRLHAATQASRIYSFLTDHRCQDTHGSGLTSYRRQLWNTQTSTCSVMAEHVTRGSICILFRLPARGSI